MLRIFQLLHQNVIIDTMYYSFACPYCSKIFYNFNDSKEAAAEALYAGIKQHQTEYSEDEKEFTLDDGESKDSAEIYAGVTESEDIPPGGYPL